ncbi:MAG: hypothetical protein ABJA70_22235 [Chryseolinea sp.]
MKSIIRLSFLIAFTAALMNSVSCEAQVSAIPQTVRAMNTIERLTDSNGLGLNEMLYGIPLPPGKVVGDNYLYLNWKISALLLYEGSKLIEGYAVRYDIAADQLDIKTSNGVKMIEGKKVKSFMWIDSATTTPSYFINAKDFRHNNVPMTGFFEVMVDGNHHLLKKTNVIIKTADYNPALSIGNRDDKILKKSEYYLASGSIVQQVPDSKKRLAAIFGDNNQSIQAYIRSADLSVKREDDLIQIVMHYNELK